MRIVLIAAVIFCFGTRAAYAQSGVEPRKDTVDSYKEYTIRLEEYKNGKREGAFLRDLAETATRMGDKVNAERIGNEYIHGCKAPYTKEDLLFMSEYTGKSSDPGFEVFYKHPEKVDPLLGEDAAINKVKSIIYKEDIQPYIGSNTDWDNIEKKVIKKYGTAGEEIFLRAKVLDYFNKDSIAKFSETAVPYVKKYGKRIPLFELNNYAWAVFEKVNNPVMLNAALGWSESTLKEEESITFLDTYANLLYKLGRKDEAIAIEEKAVKRAHDKEKPAFQTNLEKMKKGEKTWK